MIISSHGSNERNSWVKMNVGTRFGEASFKNLREIMARIINHDVLGSLGGAVGWASDFSQVTISRSVSSSPTLGSGLMAQSLEPVSNSVSPSLSAPSPTRTLCLSLSKVNIKKIFKKRKHYWKVYELWIQ